MRIYVSSLRWFERTGASHRLLVGTAWGYRLAAWGNEIRHAEADRVDTHLPLALLVCGRLRTRGLAQRTGWADMSPTRPVREPDAA